MADPELIEQNPVDTDVLPLQPAVEPAPVASANSLIAVVSPLLIWAGALYGSLSIGDVLNERLGEHSFCGPWGCGPTTGALVSWHSFSLLLIVPPVVLVGIGWSGCWVRWLAYTLIAVGSTAMVAIAIWVCLTWLPRVDPGQPAYLVQRYLFVLLANRQMVSIPIVPIVLAGVILLFWPHSSTAALRTPHSLDS